MKIMLNHSSAIPHTIKSTKNNRLSRQTAAAAVGSSSRQGQEAGSRRQQQEAGGSRSRKTTISNALRQRAQAVINDKSIDAESRAIIRYGLEINDPWLPELVRRIEAGETIFETIVLLKHPKLTPKTRIGKRSKR